MTTCRPHLAPIAAVALILGAPGAARAGGQYAGDNGSQGAQRAGAFVAKADDPTAIYYNPAGLFRAATKQFFVGFNLVSFEQSYQREGEYQPLQVEDGQAQPDYVGDPYPFVHNKSGAQAVPFLAATIPHDDKVTFGLGLFAPHGYGKRDFPTTVTTASGATAPAPQRYDAVSQSGLVVLPSVAAAYEVDDKLSIGGRASWGYFQVTTRRFAQGLPNWAEDPAQDTDAQVDVTDPFVFAWGLGVHYHPRPWIEAGFAYSAPMQISAKGTTNTVLGDTLKNLMPGEETQVVPVPADQVQCATGGAVGAIKTCVDFAMPQTATAGVRLISRDRHGREVGDIEVDLRWENWSGASEQRLVMDGQNSVVATPLEPTVMELHYRDVYSLRLGGSRRKKIRGHMCELRYGVSYESAATANSWTRLDTDTAERYAGALGVGIWLGTTRIDLGAAYIDSPIRYVHNQLLDDPNDVAARVQPDVTSPMQAADAQPYHPFNAGTYRSHYVIGSVGLTRDF